VVIPETVSVMVALAPAGSVFADTVPRDSVNPLPSVVVPSTFSEYVTWICVSDSVWAAVIVGAIPSVGVALPLV